MGGEIKVTIYGLRCPIDNKIRYVGKTICRLNERLNGHMSCDPAQATKEKMQWIAMLKEKKLRPIIEPIEVVKEKRGKDAEYKWIRYFFEKGDGLYNSKRLYY